MAGIWKVRDGEGLHGTEAAYQGRSTLGSPRTINPFLVPTNLCNYQRAAWIVYLLISTTDMQSFDAHSSNKYLRIVFAEMKAHVMLYFIYRNSLARKAIVMLKNASFLFHKK